jgi:AcrR family transcriptional regulator
VIATKSARTRQRILDSAARVFRQQGYTARLSDIAAEADLQAGSLYYHFDSRETLVEEVLRLGVEMAWQHVRAAVDALPTDATPAARLEEAVRAHASAVLEISDYTAANSRIFSMATEEVRKRHYVLQQDYGGYFHDLLEAAVASGEVRPDADLPTVRMLMFGAMNWTAEWYRPDRGRPPQLVIDQLVDMVLRGLLAAPH